MCTVPDPDFKLLSSVNLVTLPYDTLRRDLGPQFLKMRQLIWKSFSSHLPYCCEWETLLENKIRV